jgi:hypothetical protein
MQKEFSLRTDKELFPVRIMNDSSGNWRTENDSRYYWGEVTLAAGSGGDGAEMACQNGA